MLTTFHTITPHLKFKAKLVSIDNLVFKFHYRATFLLLLVCTILVTSRQYIGEHIRCITGGTIPEHVINTFCFFTTTFTVVRHFNQTMLDQGILPHPGVGPISTNDTLQHHAYYQWVPFFLFGQAIMFYLPHLIWKGWEGNKIFKLVNGLQRIALSRYLRQKKNLELKDKTVVPSKSKARDQVDSIRRAFFTHIKVNRRWAYKFIMCEQLNLWILLLLIYSTNEFLSRKFFHLGIDFIREDFDGTMDVLDIVFPKVTKCEFYKYGPSGGIQKHDALCVMALNVINEKIFVILWFWYVLLLIVNAIGIIYRIVTYIFFSRSPKFNGYIFAQVCPGRLNPSDMETLTNHFYFSDWLFLYYLAKNMEPYLFREMLVRIGRELRHEVIVETNSDDDDDDVDDEQRDSNLMASVYNINETSSNREPLLSLNGSRRDFREISDNISNHDAEMSDNRNNQDTVDRTAARRSPIVQRPHEHPSSPSSGRIQTWVDGLQRIALSRYLTQKQDLELNGVKILSRSTVRNKMRTICLAFFNHKYNKVNDTWAIQFMFCEFLNIANLLLQIFATHLFLDKQFYNLGMDFLREDFSGTMDVLDIVFPKVTKCHFRKFGPSGTVQLHDALCVMALNVINEKIFVFLWFWYAFLLLISLLGMLYRLATLVFHSRSSSFNGYIFAQVCPGRLNPGDILVVTDNFSFPDWLFLYYLAKNIEPYVFRDLLIRIAREMRGEPQSEDEEENEEENPDEEPEEEENSRLQEFDNLMKGSVYNLDADQASRAPPKSVNGKSLLDINEMNDNERNYDTIGRAASRQSPLIKLLNEKQNNSDLLK